MRTTSATGAHASPSWFLYGCRVYALHTRHQFWAWQVTTICQVSFSPRCCEIVLILGIGVNTRVCIWLRILDESGRWPLIGMMAAIYNQSYQNTLNCALEWVIEFIEQSKDKAYHIWCKYGHCKMSVRNKCISNGCERRGLYVAEIHQRRNEILICINTSNTYYYHADSPRNTTIKHGSD